MKSPALLAALAPLLLLALVLPARAVAYEPAPESRLVQAVQARALRRGDTGPEVAALQELLRSRGFDPGPIDGIFGPLTEAAVRTAQRYHGLEVDGLAGRLTVGALRGQDVAASKPDAPATRPAAAAPEGVASSSSVAAGPAGGAVIRPAAATAAGESSPSEESALVIYQAHAEPLAGAARPAAARTRTVALTFHHLPERGKLDALLDTLADAGAQATFFVTAEEAAARAADLRRLRAAGHGIGSLGYREVDMRGLSPEVARTQLQMAREVLRVAAGIEPTLFRPPLGSFNRALARLADEEGMRLILWTNPTFAMPGVEPERLAELVSDRLYPGAVVMLPLDEPSGVAAVTPLLERIGAKGYRVAPVEEATRSTGIDR